MPRLLLASGDPTIRETLAPSLQERLRAPVVSCGLDREVLELLAREPLDAPLVAGALPDPAHVDPLAEPCRRHPVVRRAILAEHPAQRSDTDQRGGAEAFFVKPSSLRRVERGLRGLPAEPRGRAARRVRWRPAGGGGSRPIRRFRGARDRRKFHQQVPAWTPCLGCAGRAFEVVRVEAAQGSEQQLIEELLEKKEKLNQQANRQRELRDRLNDETRKHAQHRDELNGRVREFIEKANQHRAKRDEMNKKVQEAKKVRDELNRGANEKAEALNELKRQRSKPGDSINLQRLKLQVKRLEYDQQTKVLTPKKEKELIDILTDLNRQIRSKEKEMESDAGVRDAYLAMKDAKDKAEESHKQVTELANAAQEQHDAMVKLFEEADAVRKQADDAQEQFVKSKTEADKVHQEYIAMVNQIRDYEKQVIGLKNKMRAARGEPEGGDVKVEAEEIYDKFKKGEKLSTEDLMALQKAGLL